MAKAKAKVKTSTVKPKPKAKAKAAPKPQAQYVLLQSTMDLTALKDLKAGRLTCQADPINGRAERISMVHNVRTALLTHFASVEQINGDDESPIYELSQPIGV